MFEMINISGPFDLDQANLYKTQRSQTTTTKNYDMKNTGIWIDTREAVIVHLESEGEIRIVHVLSDAERKPKVEGEKSKRTKRGGIGFDYESSQKNKFKEELKRYYARVIEALSGVDSLYIIGPAEAKVDLEKQLKKNPELKSKILTVEPCDSLSESKIIERIRLFFESREKNKKTRKQLMRYACIDVSQLPTPTFD